MGTFGASEDATFAPDQLSAFAEPPSFENYGEPVATADRSVTRLPSRLVSP
jgi:hypothetical protein